MKLLNASPHVSVQNDSSWRDDGGENEDHGETTPRTPRGGGNSRPPGGTLAERNKLDRAVLRGLRRKKGTHNAAPKTELALSLGKYDYEDGYFVVREEDATPFTPADDFFEPLLLDSGVPPADASLVARPSGGIKIFEVSLKVSWDGNGLSADRIRFRPVSDRCQTSVRPVPLLPHAQSMSQSLFSPMHSPCHHVMSDAQCHFRTCRQS